MIQFLMAHDVPNWAMLLVSGLSWMVYMMSYWMSREAKDVVERANREEAL